MVDPDRLDDLTGGGSSGSSSSSTNNTSSRTRDDSNSGERTKRDKLNKISGGSSSSGSSHSDGGTEDVKKLLFCLANMDAYTRVVINHDFDVFNAAQSSIKEEFAKDVSGDIVDFLGLFNVRDIIESYGYSWKNALERAVDKGDIDGSGLRTNSGNPTDDEIEDMLKCIANVLLVVEGSVREKEQSDDVSQRDKTEKSVAENMYDRYTTIVSRTNVQRIAERHGFDWQEDIINFVLQEQDLDDRLQA
jgi:hypothetical protein